jgi:uncharacterized RmlC-like cupin family protein
LRQAAALRPPPRWESQSCGNRANAGRDGTIPAHSALADCLTRGAHHALDPSGNASPPHHHPGHHTFGYVVEGTYELGINGQPTRMLKAGDVFYEPPGAIHSMSRNASTDKRLKIVVFMVADQKNPSTVNEK